LPRLRSYVLATRLSKPTNAADGIVQAHREFLAGYSEQQSRCNLKSRCNVYVVVPLLAGKRHGRVEPHADVTAAGPEVRLGSKYVFLRAPSMICFIRTPLFQKIAKTGRSL
jgi:hypothetical protein